MQNLIGKTNSYSCLLPQQRWGMSSTNIMGPWENGRFLMSNSQIILGNQIVPYLMEAS